MGYAKTIELGDNFEFGGTCTTNLAMDALGTNLTLGTIYLPSTIGEIRYAFLDVWVGNFVNTSALLNYMDGDANIVCTLSGSTTTALTLPDHSFWCQSGYQNLTNPGKRFYGRTDVKNRFKAGQSTTITFVSPIAHHDFLQLMDVQAIIRVIMA